MLVTGVFDCYFYDLLMYFAMQNVTVKMLCI